MSSRDDRDGTHECPGPGCTVRVHREMLACRDHWFQVSASTQSWVWRAYRHGDPVDHAAAIEAAIQQMTALPASAAG